MVSVHKSRREWQAPLLLAVVVAVVLASPDWLLFPAAMALANGVAAMGIVVLMRTGNVTFGQSLPMCIGAYAAALVPSAVGVNDLFLNSLLSGLAGCVAMLILGAFMKRYGGIFFAMLTLAFSMVLYGTLANVTTLGGTDGFTAPSPNLLGIDPATLGRPAAMLLAVGLV